MSAYCRTGCRYMLTVCVVVVDLDVAQMTTPMSPPTRPNWNMDSNSKLLTGTTSFQYKYHQDSVLLYTVSR